MKEKILSCAEVLVVGYGLGVAMNMGTRNVYPCILALVWYSINKSVKDYENQNYIAVLVLAFCYSLSTTLYVACNTENTKGLVENLFGYAVMFAGLTLVWNTILRYLWKLIGDGKCLRTNALENEDNRKKTLIVFACVFGILFVRLLLDYPGDVSNDSIGLIQQAFYDYEMHGGFPPILAIILRGCFSLARICNGETNLGVFFYCLIQILLFSYVATTIVHILLVHKINRYYCYLTVAYFVIIPFNVHFSHTIWKDTPFALCCALFVLLVWDQTMKPMELKTSRYWIHLLEIVVSGIGMAILRANGYYALLLCIPCGFILFWKKRKDMCFIYLVVLVLAKLIMGPLNDKIIHDNNLKVYENLQQNTAQEWANDSNLQDEDLEKTVSAEGNIDASVVEETNVSQTYGQSGLYIITSQQLAAVYMNSKEISLEEKRLLETVFKVEELKATYIPYISDHTMYSLKRIDRQQYLNIWMTIGRKHPLMYIKAWADMTCGYWYPEVKERSVYIDDLKENDYGIKRVEILPSAFYRLKEKVDRLYTRIPFYGLIWSIGAVVWVTAFCLAKAITRRNWKQALNYIPLIGVWATLLVATPVYGEFRYMYSVFFVLPLIIVMPFVDVE